MNIAKHVPLQNDRNILEAFMFFLSMKTFANLQLFSSQKIFSLSGSLRLEVKDRKTVGTQSAILS